MEVRLDTSNEDGELSILNVTTTSRGNDMSMQAYIILLYLFILKRMSVLFGCVQYCANVVHNLIVNINYSTKLLFKTYCR